MKIGCYLYQELCVAEYNWTAFLYTNRIREHCAGIPKEQLYRCGNKQDQRLNVNRTSMPDRNYLSYISTVVFTQILARRMWDLYLPRQQQYKKLIFTPSGVHPNLMKCLKYCVSSSNQPPGPSRQKDSPWIGFLYQYLQHIHHYHISNCSLVQFITTVS